VTKGITKDPSIQAFKDLMNRTLDKPTEQIQLSAELNLQTEINAKLQAARHRGRQRLLEEATKKEASLPFTGDVKFRP